MGNGCVSIDVAIDKGTLDAIMASDDWQTSLPAMAAELHRVLRSGGRWLLCRQVTLCSHEFIEHGHSQPLQISFGDDRAECIDDGLVEHKQPTEDSAVTLMVTESSRWHVVREQVVMPQAQAKVGDEPGVWYLYTFRKKQQLASSKLLSFSSTSVLPVP